MQTHAWTRGTFRIEADGRRPWITVYDPQGFPDPWINPYLTFLAWQGATPAQTQRQARCLVTASRWLDGWDAAWPTHSLADWARYYRRQDARASLRRLHSHLETLYQFYGFWHGYDPRNMAVQPLPSTRRERTAWLDRLRVDDDATGLPTTLPW